MGPNKKSRVASKLLPPASDVIWDEDVHMTSSKMRLHKGDGIFGAPPKLVTAPKSTSSRVTTPVEGVLCWRALYKYDADDRTSLSFGKGDILQNTTRERMTSWCHQWSSRLVSQ
jgi:hypothetical protein